MMHPYNNLVEFDYRNIYLIVAWCFRLKVTYENKVSSNYEYLQQMQHNLPFGYARFHQEAIKHGLIKNVLTRQKCEVNCEIVLISSPQQVFFTENETRPRRLGFWLLIGGRL